MRTKHAMKNIAMSLLSQIIIILLGFISRKIFLDSLGTEYLGVNGLLTNILSMMILIEGGIGMSITYNLYKPLAEDDHPKIIALIQLYKKAYTILAGIILLISLGLFPVVTLLMKATLPISQIAIVYMVFVAKNLVSYLTAYKWALINADQKGYVLARNNLLFQIISTIAKIVILVITSDYLLYLLIELVIYTIQVIWNGKIVNKYYPYIRTKTKYVLDTAVKENIVTNVKAMFLHNIGGYFVYGTDNILMSIFVNLSAIGLYSNYVMIIGQLAGLISPILGGVSASIGNLIATEDKAKTYEIFKIINLVNFWIYSFCTIFLYNLLEPFINLWLGEGFLLEQAVFFVLLLNFYLNGMRRTISNFKNKAGLFTQDKYAPVVEGIINLSVSIFLAKMYGLIGIFIGTTISTLVVPFFTQPIIVYNHLFERPVSDYFKKYFMYGLLVISIGFVTTWICNLVTIEYLF
ncbi:MAG: lipopolysaccharide biosynthesis protein, partial [Culicoidibacterales bacterium]